MVIAERALNYVKEKKKKSDKEFRFSQKSSCISNVSKELEIGFIDV